MDDSKVQIFAEEHALASNLDISHQINDLILKWGHNSSVGFRKIRNGVDDSSFQDACR